MSHLTKMKRKTILFFVLILFWVFSVFGCAKNTGWKAQKAPAVSSSVSEQKDEKTTSFTVSSFLHDLFGGELPADTDRYQLKQIDRQQTFSLEHDAFDGDIYRDTLYYIVYQISKVYAYNLETGETSVFTTDIGNPCNVCTDSDGVYVSDLRANEIVWFTFDGERAGSVSLPEHPHGGYDWMYERYIASLRHYDGLLLVAARDAVWTLGDGETEWRRAEYPFIQYEKVSSGAIIDRDCIAVYTCREIEGGSTYERVTKMDRKGEHAELLRDDYSQDLLSGGGRLYTFAHINGVIRMYEISSGVSMYVQSISEYDPPKPCAFLRTAVSGDTLFVLWYGKQNEFSLIPIADGWNAVRMIAPESEIRRLEEMSNCVDSVSYSYKTLDDDTFLTKLSSSLLAGETDFDIALVSGEEEQVMTLLRSLLKNGQYVDLQGSSKLNAHLDEACPGVKDFLSVKGKIAILPLELGGYWYGFSESAQNSEIPLPPADWDMDALDSYAQKLIQSGEDCALFPKSLWQRTAVAQSMVLSTIQANTDVLSDNSGTAVLEALNEFFRTWTEYGEAGLFSVNNALFGVAGSKLDFRVKGTDEYTFALPPAVVRKTNASGANARTQQSSRGKTPVPVLAFLIVNPKSERIEQALALLSDLTNEDNRYNMNIYKTPLFPDITKYYRNVVYNEETDEWYDMPQRISVVNDDNSSFLTKLDGFLGTYYSGSEICLVSMTDRAGDALADFCGNKMTGEECAKILYDELIYKLKG